MVKINNAISNDVIQIQNVINSIQIQISMIPVQFLTAHVSAHTPGT